MNTELKYFKAVPADALADILSKAGVADPDLALGYHQETVRCIHPEHEDKHPSLQVEWNITRLQSSIKLSCFPCIQAGRKRWEHYKLIEIEATYHHTDEYLYKNEFGDHLAKKSIVREYDQEDDQQLGKLRTWWTYPVIRADGKIQWYGKKKWLEVSPNQRMDELPVPSLYKLDEIYLDSSNPSLGVIFLPEGEKDVETLIAKGYRATCEPHGAGAWQADYNQWLSHYATVIILMDNDSAGIRRKSLIARGLLANGQTVKAIQFEGPEKYDVTDWFNDGHTVEEFDEIVKAAPALLPSELDSENETSGHIDIPHQERALLEQLSQEYLYLTEHGRGFLTQVVLNETTGFSVSKTTPNSLKSAFYAGYQVYLTTIKNDEPVTKEIDLIDYWNQAHRYQHPYGPQVYTRIDFDPSPTPEEGIYNLWTGLAIEPIFDEKVEGFLDFILHKTCGGDLEAYEFFLSFFAQLVQYPHKLAMVALVLRGSKGSGKSGIIDIMLRLLGKYGVVVNHWDAVTGRFNAHLASKLLVAIDDASWGGYKEGQGFLNNLITGHVLSIEGKGKDILNLKNFNRVVILGNDRWLVPKTTDDRRFFVIDVPPRSEDDDFYKHFFEDTWQQPENLAKILGYLLQYDVSKWRPIDTVIRRTVGHDMGLNDLKPLEKFLFWCASSGSLFYPSLMKAEYSNGLNVADLLDLKSRSWPTKIALGAFRASYKNWCDDFRIVDDGDETRFSRQLYQILAVDRSDKSQVCRSHSITYWYPRPLEDLKSYLCTQYKLGKDYFD